MKIEQFGMAYGVEQDRLRALLPEEFASLRPVLRVNAEIRGGQSAYLEFNTAIQSGDVRGWLNIGAWENVSFEKQGKATVFTTDALTIRFTPVGIEGGCPVEKDNAGCFFKNGDSWTLRPAEKIDVRKEFCDCEFAWRSGTHGVNLGKTLPAFPSELCISYPAQPFCVSSAAVIPCDQVLGSYVVRFERTGLSHLSEIHIRAAVSCAS